MKASAENANPVTKIIFMRLIGSKFENGEIAKVVAGPRKSKIVPRRFMTAAVCIGKG
jgi:hypothetical protein